MDWGDNLPLIVALGGGTGIGAGLTAIVTTIKAIRSGVSVREGKRRADIVQQRDEAIDAATKANRRADRYRDASDVAVEAASAAKRNEQRAREHAADLRVMVMERYGIRRDELPDWPTMEDTLTRASLEALRDADDDPPTKEQT